jgi:hypothetical protein
LAGFFFRGADLFQKEAALLAGQQDAGQSGQDARAPRELFSGRNLRSGIGAMLAHENEDSMKKELSFPHFVAPRGPGSHIALVTQLRAIVCTINNQ